MGIGSLITPIQIHSLVDASTHPRTDSFTWDTLSINYYMADSNGSHTHTHASRWSSPRPKGWNLGLVWIWVDSAPWRAGENVPGLGNTLWSHSPPIAWHLGLSLSIHSLLPRHRELWVGSGLSYLAYCSISCCLSLLLGWYAQFTYFSTSSSSSSIHSCTRGLTYLNPIAPMAFSVSTWMRARKLD